MTMTQEIDLNIILTPIPGENPAGVYLRYDPVYDAIVEARRTDDSLNRGEWQREIKTADWEKVIKLCVEALSQKTKDLQIAAWLTEALTATRGFEGLSIGLQIVNGFISQFWPHFFPQIEDNDLDFRIGSIEFINHTTTGLIKQVPLTDPKKTKGYSLLKWRESRRVGNEADSQNKDLRNQLIAEGKITPENFNTAITGSSRAFYESLNRPFNACVDQFKILDNLADEKFGKNAPKISDLKNTLEECEEWIAKILKEKRIAEPDPDPSSAEGTDPAAEMQGPGMDSSGLLIGDAQSQEQIVWKEALQIFKTSGVKKALDHLLIVSYSALSIREKNRHRLFMVKLCLKAQRPDLARPMIEELHALVEQMKLELWESPLWTGEVLEALYQCLTSGNVSDEDRNRAREVFLRLCKTDITKAMGYQGLAN